MSDNGIVNIHGKDYKTVAARVKEAHDAKTLAGVETEVLSHNPVVIKATVKIDDATYTGISSVDPASAKMIEKSNPYEVAETSAVGRALGFAGYGLIDSIASADEMVKAGATEHARPAPKSEEELINEVLDEAESAVKKEAAAYPQDRKVCSAHDEPAVMFQGKSKTKVNADGSPKSYWWHKSPSGQMCFGSGYQD